MPILETLIPAASALIIQGIQAWIEMARAFGQTDEEINAAFEAAKSRFAPKTPNSLPDA